MDRAEYYTEIRSLAEEAAKRIKAGEEQGDVVHELVDGHQWVIYTRYNYDVMGNSDTDAWQEHEAQFGGPPPSSAIAAYVVMESDLNAAIGNAEVDETEEVES